MASVGCQLPVEELILTQGRDFRWVLELVSNSGHPVDYPPGILFFEFDTTPKRTWLFDVRGSSAVLKVEHEDADLIPNRARWQLVFLRDGEPAGGDPVARGVVRRQR